MYQKSFLNATEQVGHHTGLDFVKKLAQDAMSPKYRAKALTILWVAVFVLLAILTLIIILLFGYIDKFRLGVGISTGIWAIFFGTAALFFLSSKWLTTIAGGIGSISVSDLTKGEPLTQANTIVDGIAKTVAKVAPVTSTPPLNGSANTLDATNGVDPFIVSMVWLFIIILGILCIPAFFSGVFGGGTNANTGTGTSGNTGEDTSGAGNA
jgi:hypothetical protein